MSYIRTMIEYKTLDRRSPSPVIVLRIARPVLERIDEVGQGECLTRCETIRRLISVGLDVQPPSPSAKPTCG
jgi:hypothetical protein